MSLVLKVAWRNVGRNPRRSAVLIGAVAFGVFAFVGSTAFMDGIGDALIATAVDLQGGHVQVAARGYDENPTLDARFAGADRILAAADALGGARAAAQVVSPGMANSTEQAAGIMINGVDPDREPGVTVIADRLVEGSWFSGPDAGDEVVVGAELARKLRVRLGDKIVLMASDVNSEVSASAYRIRGIYRSGSTPFDRSQVYVPLRESQRLLGFGDAVSTVAVRLDAPARAEVIAGVLASAAGTTGLEALTWKERNPMLEMTKQAYDWSAMLMAVILFAAVGFTLVNSFLMVIFERIHELGIMLAQGVKPGIIRRMLFLEAVWIALIGTGVGILASAALLARWMSRGLDLSAFAEGLGAFGVPTVVYPVIDPAHMGLGFVIILVMILLAVAWPAVRASRFEPVEALNHA